MLRTCLIFLLLGLPFCAKCWPTSKNFNGEVLKNSKWPSRYTVPGNANGYGNSKPLTLYPESPGLSGNMYKNYNIGYGILKSPQPYSKTPGYISKSAGPMHYGDPPTYVNKSRDINSKYRGSKSGLGMYIRRYRSGYGNLKPPSPATLYPKSPGSSGSTVPSNTSGYGNLKPLTLYPKSPGSSRYTVPSNTSGYGNLKPLTLYPKSPGSSGYTVPSNTSGYGNFKSPQPIPKTPGYIGNTTGPVQYRPPPTYVNLVNKYRDSNSKYRELITGLGWYNLDRISRSHDATRMYISKPGEICKIGVKKDTEYEEARIDCELMSSFTKVSVEFFGTPIIATNTGPHALEVTGSPVIVTPGMKCFIIRMLGASVAKQQRDCDLLQRYSSRVVSNGSDRVMYFCVAYLIMTFMSVFTLNIFL